MNEIYLDRNENNYGPAPQCIKVLRNADLTKLSGYSKAYQRGVKSILSERLAADFDIPEKRVILGYGAEDILKQVVQCYLSMNEKLMVPAYSWWYYKEIASEVNGINVEYPLLRGDDSFFYDVDSMLRLVKDENPRLLFISSPNNPTGNSISIDDLQYILDRVQDIIVVLDEAYWYHKDNEHARDLVNRFSKLVIIRTFSKYYALAGVRIGYALVGEELEQLMKLSNRYLGYNGLSEEIALAAMDSPDYYDQISAKMEQDKQTYYKELKKFPGFKVFKSDANFILVEIPREIMKPLQKFLKERGLIIKFMNEELLNSHIRITLGTQEENRMLINAMKEYFG